VRGWVRAPTLTPRRGFVVREAERTLRASAAETANLVARLKPGVIGRVRSCAAGSAWCEVEVATYRGFLKRDEMFGVYPNEAIGG
jgi:SH3-like domain-containing protein